MAPRLLPALALAALVAAPGAGAATPVTLRLTSYTTVTQIHDRAPRNKPNKGDSIDFKDLLVATGDQLGKKKGKPVGYDAGTVLYTSATTQKIEGVTTFPGYGTVTFAGEMKERKDGTVHVPIVRGTGSFKGAKGTLIIGKGDNKAPNTYVLRLPHALCAPGCA
ncbi:MAG TPA: hypothetical protein VFB42_13405 [Gaiellaceae bacterium]|nr:hypothetical protein [Gaiellaceae bacterium]